MAGVRVGGAATIPPTCSPPLSGYGGSATAEEPTIFRSCSTDAAGEMTVICTLDFATASQFMNPVLSPDGTKILFEATNNNNYQEIWVVDATPGSTPTLLVTDSSNYVVHPFWGDDSDTFVYVHCAGGALEDGTLYKDTVSSPGSPTALKSASGGFGAWRPMFNFDGSKIAYFWTDNGGGVGDMELRVMDADGSNDAAIDTSLYGYNFFDPPQISWANTQNLIAYLDGQSGANGAFVIAADGTGKTQVNANGDAAGLRAQMAGLVWPADDSWVLLTAIVSPSAFCSMIRAELDGSTTTELNNTTGAVDQNGFRAGPIFGGRIWFVSATSSHGSSAQITSMALDGTDVVVNFDNGTGTQVDDFIGGDGWYWN